MKAPFRWTFPAIAVAALLVAIVVGSNEAVAIPAATLAVAAAALTLWDSVRNRAPGPSVAASAEPSVPVGGSDVWFHEGTMGQESIVLMLDRIDRALFHPGLPVRGSVELARLTGLSRERFLEYVAARLTELEAGS
jgi:hypothetical protein